MHQGKEYFNPRQMVMLLPLLLCWVSTLAQNEPCAPSSFLKTYGNNAGFEQPQDIVPTQDGGFLVVGKGAIKNNSFILKLSNTGETKWLRHVSADGDSSTQLNKIIRTKDGKYLALGTAYAPPLYDLTQIWLVKLDENGSLIWNKRVPFTGGMSIDGLDIIETSDQGFVILAGHGVAVPKSIMLKLSSTAQVQWCRNLPSMSELFSLTESGGYLYVSGLFEGYRGFVIRQRLQDGEGETIGLLSISNKITYIRNIYSKGNHLYLNACTAEPSGVKQHFVKMDTSFAVLSASRIEVGLAGEVDNATMFPSVKGGYITAVNLQPDSDIFLYELTADGQMDWNMRFNQPDDQFMKGFKATADHGIAGVGLDLAPGRKIFVVKTDSVREKSGCGSASSLVSIHPAPYSIIKTPVTLLHTQMNNSEDVISTVSTHSFPAVTICQSSASSSEPAISIASPGVVRCEGELMRFVATVSNAAPGSKYQWFINGEKAGINSNVFETTMLENQDTVSCGLTTQTSCGLKTVTSNNIIVYLFKKPVLMLVPPAAEITAGDSIRVHAQSASAATFKWMPAAYTSNSSISNPWLFPRHTKRFTVEVKSAEGCKAEQSLVVTVVSKIIIPNAFSPNADGVNDTWELSGLQHYHHLNVNVFNRWGQVVFKSAGYKTPWNGTFEGKRLPAGTYYYVIEVNGSTMWSGALSLLQ